MKIISIQTKNTKTGKTFYLVWFDVAPIGQTSLGPYSSWTYVKIGDCIEAEVEIKGDYKSLKNIRQIIDSSKVSWNQERLEFQHTIQQQTDEIKLLKEQIAFLKELVKR